MSKLAQELRDEVERLSVGIGSESNLRLLAGKAADEIDRLFAMQYSMAHDLHMAQDVDPRVDPKN